MLVWLGMECGSGQSSAPQGKKVQADLRLPFGGSAENGEGRDSSLLGFTLRMSLSINGDWLPPSPQDFLTPGEAAADSSQTVWSPCYRGTSLFELRVSLPVFLLFAVQPSVPETLQIPSWGTCGAFGGDFGRASLTVLSIWRTKQRWGFVCLSTSFFSIFNIDIHACKK